LLPQDAGGTLLARSHLAGGEFAKAYFRRISCEDRVY
jgi:hypothetical protein